MNINKDNINRLILGYGIVEDFSKIESWRLRGFFYIGGYSHLASGTNAWNVIVGRYTRIDANVQLGFRIANNALFSNHYFAYSEEYLKNKEYNLLKAERFYYDKQSMTFVGNDVRIHQGCVIRCGVNIGDGAIIYPNSVVDSDIPPYAVVAGNPAKVICYRFSSDTINRIINSEWYGRDLSVLSNVVDYSDVNNILMQLTSSEYIKKEFKKHYVNSYLNEISDYKYKRLVIGPSHIDIWQSKVNSGERTQPDFLMYGVNGLSLYSDKLKCLIKWFIDAGHGDVVLFVPDFRIGNVILKDNHMSLDPLFISKEEIKHQNDEQLFEKALDVLDYFVSMYGGKIKFIFWCLMGRESENKKQGRHISDNSYHHPVWNYSFIKERYSDNIFDVGEVEGSISEYIQKNGTIHPTNEGYNLLEKIISSSE